MGVYKPRRKGKDGIVRETPYFHFDFTIGGERFFGSTGQENRRAAEAFERRKRAEVADGTINPNPAADLTLDQAANLYWEDVGQHRRSAAGIEREIEIILEIIGKKKRIGAVRTADVQALITKRRAGEAARGERAPSPATINRTLETLRAVLRHVEEVYESPLPKIAWRRMMLPEPKPPERTFAPAELEAWSAELGALERFALILLATYGMRFGELFMPPESIDTTNPDRPVMLLGRYQGRAKRESRKDGTLLEITLLPDDAVILAALAERAKSIKAESIWVEQTPRGLREVKYYAMRKRMAAAAARAKIKPGRLIHSLRHHAATALVSQTNDITLARKLLGHSSITTTQRYAHASEANLMGALARLSVTRPELPSEFASQVTEITTEKMVPPPGLEPGTDDPERNEKPE